MLFLGERGVGVPTKFFCSSYIYGRCWSRILMMPSWHPWGNWVICKLKWPLTKFYFWVITRLLYKINEILWCLQYDGQWFWLDHCREDPALCMCIIMQIRSAITEIASVCPKMMILVIMSAMAANQRMTCQKFELKCGPRKWERKNITAAPELTRT